MARAWVVGMLWLAAAGVAAADTVRVVRDRAPVWNRPTGVSVILTQLPLDTVVDVVGQVNQWYEVVLPAGASRVPTRTGFIRATEVVVESVGPPSADAVRLAAGTRRAGRRRPTTILHLDVARRWSGDEVVRTSAPFAPTLAEDGQLTAAYGRTDGWQIDVLAGQAVAGSFGVGVGAGYTRRSREARVTAGVPHPFFFDQPRPAAFTTRPLGAYEASLHLAVLWMPPTRGRVKFIAFGGPAAFRVSQTVVVDLVLADPYPYDTATVSRPVVETRTATRAGFQVGGDISYLFTRRIGVGVGARYSRASLMFPGDEATTSGTAGGARIVAGGRIRF